MGGLFGKNKNSTTYAPMVNSMRIQTSCYGRPIPLAYGKNRIAGNLIWYGDFTAIPHSSTQSSGGKGGGGGSQTSVSYTYTAAVAIALCEGPIISTGRVWKGKDVFPSVSALFNGGLFTGTFPTQPPWSYLTSLHPGQDLGYQLLAYVAGGPYDLGSGADLGDHSFELLGFNALGTLSGAAKTFTLTPATTKTFTTTAGSALITCTAHGFPTFTPVVVQSSGVLPTPFLPGVAYYIVAVDANHINLLLTPRFSFKLGALVAINVGSGTHQAVRISDLVGTTFTSVAHSFFKNEVVRLTTTGTLPAGLALATDYYVQVVDADHYKLSTQPDGATITCFTAGTGTHTTTPIIVDCRPSDVLVDFLTDANHGAFFPSAQLGNWTQFSNYVTANNLLISPFFDSQDTAANIVNEIVQGVNCELVFSEGLLKVVPYGDAVVTGNGATFTPNLTPVYDLTDDDYLSDGQNDPVTVDRSDPADAWNTVKVEFLNRSNNYAPEIAEAQDMYAIQTYGQRLANVFTFHWICDVGVAQKVAQLLLQRLLYVRNKYSFTLGWRFAVLEPMDLVTLTDSVLGINQIIVRIKTVEEDEDGNLSFTAEDALLGSHNPTLYTSQVSAPFNTNYNANPGNVTAPFILDAPGVLTDSGYELWAGVSGGPDWGGAEVWVSTDGGATYKQVGTVFGNGRYGGATNAFPIGSDPDTTNSLSVDLTVSSGALSGGAQFDADALNTLSIIDRELIAFQTATLTTTYNYTLGTYIRRGAYNSLVAAHDIGAPFARLDQALFRYAYDPALVGAAISFKFVSFNKYNAAQQDISTLPAYTYTPLGSTSYPDDITGFNAAQNGNVVMFTWDLLTAPLNPNIDGYEIRYAAQGDMLWSDGTPLTQVTRGTQVTSARLPPGAWTCMIKARDHSNNYSVTPSFTNVNVTNTYTVIAVEDQTKGWPNQELAVSNTVSITAPALTFAAPLTVEWSGTVDVFVSNDNLSWSGSVNAANTWLLFTDSLGRACWKIIDSGGTGHQASMSVGLSAGVPHHLLGSYDGTNITLYADGVQVATLSAPGLTFSSTGTPKFAPPASGRMCEARLFNGALSAVDAAARYQGFDNTTALVLKYLFNYQSLKTAGQVADLSGSGNTGTIAGTPAYIPSSFAQKFATSMLGILVPESTVLASAGATGYEVFDNFVNSPFQYCTYTTRDFDLGSDGSVRLHGELLSGLGPGVVAGTANPALYEDDRLIASNYHGFTPWSIGTAVCSFFKMKTIMDTLNQGLAYVKGFSPTADSPPLVQSAGNITVPNTGLTITFPTRYHNPPTVKITIIGVTALSVTINNVTATSFDVHVFNSAGTQVGGTIIWESTGV